MNKIRNILTVALIGVAAFAFTPKVSAQGVGADGYKTSTVFNGGTNIVAALTTNGYFTIELPKAYPDVLFFCSFKFNTTAGAGDDSLLHLDLYRGDLEGFESSRWSRWTMTGNGTTIVSNILTTNILAAPMLRGRLATTGTNLVATNVVFRYGWKD